VNADDRAAEEGELGVLKTSCVYTGRFDAAQNKAIVPQEYARASCPLQLGRLIVSRMNTPDLVGAAGLVKEAPEGIYLPDRLWQVSLREVVPEFVYYWTRSDAYQSQVQASCSGTSSSMQNLSQTQFLAFDFPFPPFGEQLTIAAFLDREAGKIDALVAEQERLIALLKEKRQAVISQAVTKGLDPNVPMKDSGVEWLGEVPAHWKVGSLKRFWTVLDCKHVTAEFVDEGLPLASIREVQDRYVDLSYAKQTTPAFYEMLVDGHRKPVAGDLIFSRNATVGEVAQVAAWHPPFAMGQDVCLLRRLDENASPDFLQATIKSRVVVEQLALCMIGSTFKNPFCSVETF
jgi:type I restriction enzyme, S subunit